MLSRLYALVTNSKLTKKSYLVDSETVTYTYNYHSANSIVFYNCSANGNVAAITSIIVGTSSMRVEWSMKTTGNTVSVGTGNIPSSGRRVEIFYS